jgi:hypothetical protein
VKTWILSPSGSKAENFLSKGDFWLHLHCREIYRTSNNRCRISPCLWICFYLPGKVPHLSLQQTMALGLCTERMCKQDLVVRSRVVLLLQRVLHCQFFHKRKLPMLARERSLVLGKRWYFHAEMVPRIQPIDYDFLDYTDVGKTPQSTSTFLYSIFFTYCG